MMEIFTVDFILNIFEKHILFSLKTDFDELLLLVKLNGKKITDLTQ